MGENDSRIDRRNVLRALGAGGVGALAGCGGDDGGNGGNGNGGNGNGGNGNGGNGNGNGGNGNGNGGNGGGQESVSAAWVYVSEIGDLGWSWAHNEGRKAVDEKYDWLETDFTEAVAPGDAERVFRQLAEENDLIFGTTFGYQDPMLTVAEEFPDTYFEHATGFETAENMGRYMGKIYQPRYLAGQATGMITENNTIGYVAAFPIAEVVRSINAMTLGARSVNPEATFKVRWVNAWFDPQTSQEAANALIDEGVDVVAQEQDSPAAVRAANEAGVWSSGYNAPMGEFGGEKYIISPIWDWSKIYDPTAVSVKEGTWDPDFFWGGMETGVPTLDEWGPNVPQEVKDTVAETRGQILDGELDIWEGSKFEGESDEFLFQEMSSFVEGVEGEVPE